MNIKAYLDTQRGKLAEVLTREELPCRLVRTVQGPLALTWQLAPCSPDASTLRRLQGLGNAIQAAMRVESVRIQLINGLVEVQIPSPCPMTPGATDMLRGSNGLRVAMGLDSMGELVTVDLGKLGALAWVGPAGRGKTQSMRSTTYSLARSVGGGLRYSIICQPSKLDDWRAFDNTQHSLGLVTEAKEIAACVKFHADLTRVGGFHWQFILIIDDLPSILQIAGIEQDLSTIASVGRAVGVRALIGTQALGSNAGSGGQLVESNLNARIIYKPASKATGARNAGSGGLSTDDLSACPGDALLLVDGVPARVATAYCSDTTARSLPVGEVTPSRGAWRAMTAEKFLNGGWQGGAAGGAATGASGATRVRVGGGGSGAAGATGADKFTLYNHTMPNRAQRAQLYKEWVRLERKTNATLVSVFGYKSGKNLPWLTQAINENKPDNKVINMAERRG